MIRVPSSVFDATCRDRGYDVQASMGCVVEIVGTTYVVDETHPAYPRKAASNACHAGRHLSQLLARFGITYTPGCKCRDMAAKMDALGCEWCESDAGMGEILEAMRTEAAKRSLPFLDAVGKLLVRRAVKAARREQERAAAKEGETEGGSSAV